MRTLNNSLSILCRHHLEDWHRFVPGVAFAYNSSVHASTGVSPFALNTGRVPFFPGEGWLQDVQDRNQAAPPPLPVLAHEYLQELRYTIEHARAHARRCLESSWLTMRRKYDERPDVKLIPGDRVLVRLSEFERSQYRCRKLAPRWSEPAEVESVLSNGKTYRVRRADGVIEVVNVQRLFPVPKETWSTDEGKQVDVSVSPSPDDKEDSDSGAEEPSWWTRAQVPPLLSSSSTGGSPMSIAMPYGATSSSSVSQAYVAPPSQGSSAVQTVDPQDSTFVPSGTWSSMRASDLAGRPEDVT
jgi:hypothetical protein